MDLFIKDNILKYKFSPLIRKKIYSLVSMIFLFFLMTIHIYIGKNWSQKHIKKRRGGIREIDIIIWTKFHVANLAHVSTLLDIIFLEDWKIIIIIISSINWQRVREFQRGRPFLFDVLFENDKKKMIPAKSEGEKWTKWKSWGVQRG